MIVADAFDAAAAVLVLAGAETVTVHQVGTWY